MSTRRISYIVALGAALASQAPVAGAQATATRPESAVVVRTAAGATGARTPASVAGDSAIVQLQAFLQRYPNSTLRPRALFQLGELLVKRAEEEFERTQRANTSGDVPIRPAYGPAIQRYEELVTRFPNFEQIDAAAYTLGTLYFTEQRYPDAARMFEVVAARDTSRFRPEALFRLGDSYFEIAAQQRGEQRRATFARAATAYERAVAQAPKNGDIYFLSLYKLGWSYYNQATQTNQAEYQRAVQTFGELVTAYDQLSAEQQQRLGLKQEAIEYMAVAFTQVGGAQAAERYFAQEGRGTYRLPVLKRVAQALRDQGDFTGAVAAYQDIVEVAPSDSSTLAAQREIIDIYQNRMLEPARAQEARLALVERFGPNSEWVRANPALADTARAAREEALRQSGQYLLANAQRTNDRAQYGQAAQLYERYMSEYGSSDSARAVAAYMGEAYFGQGEYMRAGAAYSRAAYGFGATADTTAAAPARGDTARLSITQRAALNAIVAYDSALARNKNDRAAQDSMFSAVDRFASTYPQAPQAKNALITKARRASESQRWDVMASTFQTFVQRYPNDPYTPTAQKSIGDALYRSGNYADAQVQWESAQTQARAAGRTALADSISRVRQTAVDLFADTLIKQGQYRRAAEEVYVAFADKNPQSAKAPDALRNAIETYMIVVDSAQKRNTPQDEVRQSRDRAIELTSRLTTQYPRYQYRLQYQNLNARLLAEAGRRDEAIASLRQIIATNPNWPGRAEAQIRLATTLDSAGNKREAAQEYARFSELFPRDRRAADALFNSAVTYVEAGDTATAVRTYASFAQRYPRDERAAQARTIRTELILAGGDSAAARAELARACANPTDALRARCASRVAETAYRAGTARWPGYKAERFTLPARITQQAVQRAQSRKQQILRAMAADFARAIQTGNPEYLAASTYHLGLAQWEYGEFLRNVQLPSGLNEQERTAATEGAAKLAEPYFAEAKETWQALVNKAEEAGELRSSDAAKVWVDRAQDALRGNIPANPPVSSAAVPAVVGSE
jgi:TolA-binding protein